MRSDFENDKSINNCLSKGYGAAKEYLYRTLNPARKKQRFLARIQGIKI
jgi:hypothetical protein